MTAEEAQAKFFGKMVKVKFKGSWISGRCNFIGINEHLGWQQVTVDRLPVKLSSFDEVELFNGRYNHEMYIDGIKAG